MVCLLYLLQFSIVSILLAFEILMSLLLVLSVQRMSGNSSWG